MTSKEKVAALREEMQKNNVDAFIVYSADPHMSEYLPEEWQERAWLSGFLGSAGFVVITKDKAGLWTDGRYFTQAPIELAGSGIDLFKDGMEGTPNYIDWIISEIPANGKVAVKRFVLSQPFSLQIDRFITERKGALWILIKGLDDLLKKNFNIVIKDKSLLDEAFTQASYVNEHPNENLKSEWRYYLEEAEQKKEVKIVLRIYLINNINLCLNIEFNMMKKNINNI